ncbi:MAG TPA: hypothetical protein VGD16_10370 [Enterovirga sp.]|jgi:hypothetical protein
MAAIKWTQQKVAGVPLQHFLGRAGAVEVGSVTYDGSNGMWAWASPLADDAWGYAQTPEGAQQALTIWLIQWLENFRPLLDENGSAS